MSESRIAGSINNFARAGMNLKLQRDLVKLDSYLSEMRRESLESNQTVRNKSEILSYQLLRHLNIYGEGSEKARATQRKALKYFSFA
jgi:hypothetical protein